MQVGFARTIITPSRGLPLAGYFNPRPNQGVYDDISVRCILFRHGSQVGGIVSLEVCMFDSTLPEIVREALLATGFKYGKGLIFTATHTHTAPYATEIFGQEPDHQYLNDLVVKIVETIHRAYRNLAPATLRIGKARDNPMAFNRRYWMRDGGVMTNPGVGNPAVLRTEGKVDREIGILSVEQGGRITAILANIVNHTDSVGADLVSADWPGRMERFIWEAMGDDPMVMTLIGCSGNINQIDVTSTEYQGYGYERTRQLGRCYAECILSRLSRLKRLDTENLGVVHSWVSIAYRRIPASMRRDAERILEGDAGNGESGDLTSEGLASGQGAVARFFARQLLEYAEKCSGKSRRFRVATLSLGRELAITSLPGEPFTEIGMSIKKRSPFKHTWPVTLANGYCGYVALPESFERGGYETLPVVGGAPRKDTAGKLVAATLKNLGRLECA